MAWSKPNMARLASFFVFTILVLSIAELWLLKIVVDKARSLFPSELPERPQKARKPSLTKRISQKLGSSKNKNKSVGSSPSEEFTQVEYASLAPVANNTSRHVLTRHTPSIPKQTLEAETSVTSRDHHLPRLIQSIFSLKRVDTGSIEGGSPPQTSNILSSINHQNTAAAFPIIHRKPLPSTVDVVVKDPILDRFERLKLPQNGISQPRSSTAAVSPPSPQITSTAASTSLPTIDFFQAARTVWDNIATSNSSLPSPQDHLLMGRPRSNSGARPHAISMAQQKGILIEEDSEKEADNITAQRSRKSFRRRTLSHKRALPASRNSTTLSQHRIKRRSRSPSLSSSNSDGNLTPSTSDDTSHLNLSVQAVVNGGLRQSQRPEHVDTRFLDSQEAFNLREQLDQRFALRLEQEDEEQYQSSLFAQLSAAARPSEARRRRNITRLSATTGTQERPINLDSDSDSDSDSDDSDRVLFTGRNRGLGRAADDAEPMDLDDNSEWKLPSNTVDLIEPNLDLELAQLLQEEENRIRQVAAGTRECAVCGNSSPIADLPSLANCQHPPQTCVECYSGWLTAQLQESGWKEAKCPEGECKIKLSYHEIQQIAPSDIFQQYDNFIARAAISEDPNFRWCRACSSGQIHMSGEEGNIFTCASCAHKVCIIHENTWHEGETCDEYDYRSSGRKERDQKAQEAASLKAVKKMSKKCPGPDCLYRIEKNEGCDHMTCSKCRYEFCWVCLCDYNKVRAVGNAAHADSCQYHTGRLPD